MFIPREDQFTGCLIGQCLGDALGFVVEGQSPSACRSYVENSLREGRTREHSRGGWLFGQYSDDSQLAREFLQSYVACRGFVPADYARRIAAIFGEGRIVGRGRTTEAAAERLLAGIPWDEAGTPSPAAGNGSAMRAGPIGLVYHDDCAAMLRAAHDQGRITHQDGRCSAGAVAIAGAVFLVLQGGPIQARSFLTQLSTWVEPQHSAVATYLQQLIEWVTWPPDRAVEPIRTAGVDPTYRDRWQGISPFVTCSVLWSLYAFLRSPDDYWQTIGTAIAVGGDVDTTAAMAGAISGAYLGLAALPLHLARQLTDRGTWRFEELVELARQSFHIKTRHLF